MRVLLSAYACEPGIGSEPEVGLAAVLGAARHHEVWVLTRNNNVDAVKSVLDAHGLASRVRVVGLDLGRAALTAKRHLGQIGLNWYYDRWQVAAGKAARRLDAEIGFDVVHHVTFATGWGRIGVAATGKPLVVGPVGGFATTPGSLLPVMGWRGVAGEISRRLLRPLLARLTGSLRAQASAAVLFLQNSAALRGRQPGGDLLIMPNGLVGVGSPTAPMEQDSPPRIVFAGNLIPLKGAILAVEAMRYLRHPTATLDIYGDGPERPRLEKAIVRWDLQDRVRIHAPISRSSLLDVLARASVLVHPALHDEAGLVVAEALSSGTPVACLDIAGPPVVAGFWPEEMFRAVPPGRRSKVIADLAVALDELIGVRGEVGPRRRELFLETIEAAYRAAVQSESIR